MAAGRVRYDGLGDWYDGFAGPAAASNADALRALLVDASAGDGPVLDLGCGTGLFLGVLGETGRHVVGVDLSRDQLRNARTRSDRVACADAAALPFADASFAIVAAIWMTTDVDDLGAVLAEARRVVRPDGRLVVYGVHPCFNGPHVEAGTDGARIIHPSYRHAGLHEASPWWGEAGVRRRVGMRHVPLAELVNAVVGARFRIVRMEEPRDDAVPAVLAIVAEAG